MMKNLIRGGYMTLFRRGTSWIPDVVFHRQGGAGLPRDHVLIAGINFFIYSQNEEHNPQGLTP